MVQFGIIQNWAGVWGCVDFSLNFGIRTVPGVRLHHALDARMPVAGPGRLCGGFMGKSGRIVWLRCYVSILGWFIRKV